MLSHIVLILLLAELKPVLQFLCTLLQEVDLLLKLMFGEVGVLLDQLIHAGLLLSLKLAELCLGVLQGFHSLSVSFVEPIKVASRIVAG